MSSGVAIADDCKSIFEDIKKNKSYRYCVFYIKEEKSITVEAKGDRDSSYDDFLHDLQSGGDVECRYGLFDFEYEHQCQVKKLPILRIRTSSVACLGQLSTDSDLFRRIHFFLES